MELVIEHVGRGSRHFEYQKVTGDRVTIGRAFDNDIVLADPHVCAHHAVIESDQNSDIILRDLDSVNGVRTKKHRLVDDRHKVTSGEEFIIGKTHIRIFRQDHKVVPSIRLNQIEKLVNFAGKPWVVAAVVVATIILIMFQEFSNQLEEFHTGRNLVTALAAMAGLSIWPACWSIYARIKKHELRFLSQLSVTLIFLLLMELSERTGTWISFHTGTNTGFMIFNVSFTIFLTLLLIWTNFYLSGFQSSKKRWIYSTGLTVVLTSLFYLVLTMESDRFAYIPKYHAKIYPPSISVYSAEPVETYLENAEKVFSESGKKVKE